MSVDPNQNNIPKNKKPEIPDKYIEQKNMDADSYFRRDVRNRAEEIYNRNR